MKLIGIPDELKQQSRWVLAGKGKIPLQPNGVAAKSNDETTWSSFTDCVSALTNKDYIGIGYELGGGIIGIDFDHCKGNEDRTKRAMYWIQRFGSYAETSISGNGYHIFVKGQWNGGGKNLSETHGVECYPSKHYFIMTGEHIDGLHTVIENQAVLDEFHEYIESLVRENQKATNIDKEDGEPIPVENLYDGIDPEDGNEWYYDRLKKYYAQMPVTISGHGGDKQCYENILGLLANCGATPGEIMDVMQDVENERTNEQWTHSQLNHKIRAAIKYAAENAFDIPTIRRKWFTPSAETYGFTAQTLPTAPAPAAQIIDPNRKDYSCKNHKAVVSSELLSQPEPQWLIEGLFQENSLVQLYGKANCGKSYVAMECGLSLAEGLPFLGQFKTTQCNVIYLSAEGGWTMGGRLKAWCKAHNRPVPMFLSLQDAWTFTGEAQTEEVNQLLRIIEQYVHDHGDVKKPTFLIVDTLAMCFGGGDENSSRDFNSFVSAMNFIKNTKKCTILMVHHTGYNADRARGSSVGPGAWDTTIRASGSVDNLTLTCDKQRGAAKFEPFNLTTTKTNDNIVLRINKQPIVEGKEVIKSDRTLGWLLFELTQQPMTIKELMAAKVAAGKQVKPYKKMAEMMRDCDAMGYVIAHMENKSNRYTLTDMGKALVSAVVENFKVNKEIEELNHE